MKCARFQRKGACVPPTPYPLKNKSENLLVEGGVELILWFWPATGNRAANAEKTSAYGLLVFPGRQRSLVNVLARSGILLHLTQMSGKHFL